MERMTLEDMIGKICVPMEAAEYEASYWKAMGIGLIRSNKLIAEVKDLLLSKLPVNEILMLIDRGGWSQAEKLSMAFRIGKDIEYLMNAPQLNFADMMSKMMATTPPPALYGQPALPRRPIGLSVPPAGDLSLLN